MADKANRTLKAATAEVVETVVKEEKPVKVAKTARTERPSTDERNRKAVEAARLLNAARFKALGDPTRLRAVELLRDRFLEAMLPSNEATEETSAEDATAELDADGLTVGTLSVALGGKPKGSSTLSHHLKELRQAGLISMRRRGKTLICRVEPEALSDLRCVLETHPPRRRAPAAEMTAPTKSTKLESIAEPPITADSVPRVKRASLNGKSVPRGKNVLTSADTVA